MIQTFQTVPTYLAWGNYGRLTTKWDSVIWYIPSTLGSPRVTFFVFSRQNPSKIPIFLFLFILGGRLWLIICTSFWRGKKPTLSLFQVNLWLTTEKGHLKPPKGITRKNLVLSRLFGYENFAEAVKELIFNVARQKFLPLALVELLRSGGWWCCCPSASGGSSYPP